MITYRIKEKQFRQVTLHLSGQNDVDMIEVICHAVISDKVTATAQSAALELISIIRKINEEQS